MKKIKVAVVFGGTNTEHEVSLVSGRSIITHLDKKKYEVLAIKITKDNQWTIDQTLSTGQSTLSDNEPTSANKQSSSLITPLSQIGNFHADIIFPVIHGPFGEDGTLQGVFEIAKTAYVGCGVLASAVCMDKPTQKMICHDSGIPIVPFVNFTQYQWLQDNQAVITSIQEKLTYPVFVKPANQGSSVGISKADSQEQLQKAIRLALEFDTKVIVEQGIENVREIECSILGNHQPQASVLGEIIPSNEFYDYDAKYVDGKSRAIIPANLPSDISQQIQQAAIRAFQILDCRGLARVDFIVDGKTNRFYLNELNTMPGFTNISMYPKLWEASGMTYEQLLDKLITLGLENHAERSRISLTYTPKLDWYK